MRPVESENLNSVHDAKITIQLCFTVITHTHQDAEQLVAEQVISSAPHFFFTFSLAIIIEGICYIQFNDQFSDQKLILSPSFSLKYYLHDVKVLLVLCTPYTPNLLMSGHKWKKYCYHQLFQKFLLANITFYSSLSDRKKKVQCSRNVNLKTMWSHCWWVR